MENNVFLFGCKINVTKQIRISIEYHIQIDIRNENKKNN